MATLTGQFSANRCVREYVEKYYLPGAASYRARTASKGALSAQMVNWKHRLNQNWGNLRFSSVKIETKENRHEFEVHLYLNGLDPNAVRVELYAEEAQPQTMELLRGLSGDPSTYVYTGSVPASRPPEDYTARVVPFHEGVSIPLEIGHILWQR